MESPEIFIFLVIILIIVTINQNSKILSQLQLFDKELKLLRKQLLNFITEKTEVPTPIISPIEIVKSAPESLQQISAEAPLAIEPATYVSLFVDDKPSVFPIVNQDAETTILPQASEEEIMDSQEENIPEYDELAEKVNARPTLAYPVSKPTFFERYPDLEKFIGENLINKIGIAILVLAIGFFVKYAIDQNWIGAIGRVSIGIVCGGILVAVGHKMHNNYKSFSSVLAGGGMAIFYFTITLAYHQFNLFDQTTAFIIMVVITIFAVLLSLLYDKEELAIIALVGGFASPFLVSNGSGNYQVLFTYLIILNIGILLIAYKKSWRILNCLSFIFTIILFGSWLNLLNYTEPSLTYKNAFLFATVFYLLYFVINIVHNIREKKKFIASDYGILLASTGLYFSAGLYCLGKMDAASYKGIFSATIGIFNLGVTYFLFRKQKVDNNILYLLIGITLTCISVTAPIQLHGNNITIFWASEAVLLYWLFTKSKISIIEYSSIIIWALMNISLGMDLIHTYGETNNARTIIFNRGFITIIFAAIATYLLCILWNKEDLKGNITDKYPVPPQTIFRNWAIAMLFLAGSLEINFQFSYYFPGTSFNMLYLLLYTIVFINIFNFLNEKIKGVKFSWQKMAVLLSICVVLYFLCMPQTFTIQSNLLTNHTNGIHFLTHWATAIFVAVILYRLMQSFQNNKQIFKENYNILIWVMCSISVLFLSLEIALLANNFFYNTNNPLENVERIYIKTGLPILWGLCSFTFMWLGMKNKFRALRIFSLTLFALTLLKLFIFDIRNIPVGGKIAAFFCLGIILLVVSFMYQRWKKLIVDEEEKVD